jgi:Protein of unknown function (DUF2971)
MSAPRQIFYKYTSARVAKTVLATRRLRYSSPLRFNDPFDVTQELRLNFDERGLYAALCERVAWLTEHGDATPVRHPVFGPLLRLAMDAGADARRAMASELRRQAGSPTPGQAEALKELKDRWRVLVPTFRILCLSEVNDSAPMWYHYADGYKGIVLQFSAVEDVDSVFRVARPVVYQDTPSIADANAWVSCVLHEGDARWQDLFMEYLYVKKREWSYEKEWRVPVPGRRRSDDNELFGDYGFHARELTAIYFGPRCSEQDREDLLKLLAHGLDHVEDYQMDFDTQQARLVARTIER